MSFEPRHDPTANCNVCGVPMKQTAGGYIHDWSKAPKEQRDVRPAES